MSSVYSIYSDVMISQTALTTLFSALAQIINDDSRFAFFVFLYV